MYLAPSFFQRKSNCPFCFYRKSPCPFCFFQRKRCLISHIGGRWNVLNCYKDLHSVPYFHDMQYQVILRHQTWKSGQNLKFHFLVIFFSAEKFLPRLSFQRISPCPFSFFSKKSPCPVFSAKKSLPPSGFFPISSGPSSSQPPPVPIHFGRSLRAPGNEVVIRFLTIVLF